jgi:hypothetical protein
MQQDNLKSNKHGCTDTKPVRIKVFHRITPPPKVHFSIKWIENSVTHHYNFSYNCRDSMNSRHHLGKKLVDFFLHLKEQGGACMYTSELKGDPSMRIFGPGFLHLQCLSGRATSFFNF